MSTDAKVRDILEHSPTMAVVGIHRAADKPAFYVPEYLHDHGYRVLGVNPALVGETLFGEPVHATLAELTAPIELVDVFRRSEAIPAHLDDILAMRPLPKVVWFQLGITNDAVAAVLERAGITVIQNRCTLADHRRLGLGAPIRASGAR